jgi:hypothetical protein
MAEPILMKFDMYVIALEPILMRYFINSSHQSVCLNVCCHIIARQRLGKNVAAATNKHATVELFFDASFSVLSVYYQRKVGD